MTVLETDEQFLERVCELTGIDDRDAARRAARAVTTVLLEQIPSHDRKWLGGFLPPDMQAATAPLRPADALPDFYERIASREGIQPGFATEHAQSVCQALGERLSDEARLRLTRLLPDALAELFAGQAHAQVHASHAHAQRSRQTLAEGRAGSSHPLSEAAPQRAQSESVARSGNPHADTKVSSSGGTTQERERETLAEYDPASKKPA